MVDADAGQSGLQAIAAGTPGSGGFGVFEVSADGVWTYRLDNGQPAVQGLLAGEKLFDRIVVRSQDGTDDETIEVTIEGAGESVTVSSAEAYGIADGSHFHTANGTLEVGNWYGETVRGLVEFDVDGSDFSRATLTFDGLGGDGGLYGSAGTFSGSVQVYAYRGNGTVENADFGVTDRILIGTVADFASGSAFSFDVTDALSSILEAGGEFGVMFDYSGAGGTVHFDDFGLVIG